MITVFFLFHFLSFFPMKNYTSSSKHTSPSKSLLMLMVMRLAYMLMHTNTDWVNEGKVKKFILAQLTFQAQLLVFFSWCAVITFFSSYSVWVILKEIEIFQGNSLYIYMHSQQTMTIGSWSFPICQPSFCTSKLTWYVIYLLMEKYISQSVRQSVFRCLSFFQSS